MSGPHCRREEAGNQESESNPASRHDGDFNRLNLTEIRQLVALRLRRSLDCGKPDPTALTPLRQIAVIPRRRGDHLPADRRESARGWPGKAEIWLLETRRADFSSLTG